MRYRITIEIETDAARVAVNKLAVEMKNAAVTRWSNPVFLSTEIVADQEETIFPVLGKL